MIVLTVLTEAMFGPLRWIHLGLSLGLLMPTLNVIGRTNGDANDHLKLTLRYWLEKKDNVTGTTWDNLIRAVRSTGDMAAAERMPGILRSKLSSIDQPNTPDTDRRQGKIDKWLEEGEVVLKVTRINMHGAPGAGKTCSKHLLLNEPPPTSTDSTPIACRAVEATRISIDDKTSKWERVERKDLFKELASHLDKAPNETKHENFKFARILCLIIVFCYNFVKNSIIGTFLGNP
ncbi:PREDICTED: uncharacterized protein LOC109590085 [Amphimedon queenslandica]|uniref:Death domain-containing protein n=1 Tax=Amphimedon queenslandica TaxID=400682 RepID=A0AAN0JWM5_AMPQE|nr:PREDICTED: uncharacterized protein LOC109590085 [Amphimedon queenslandica]|eukprot:XP_019861590.1 PREDICTED: uncharacterized protein LOC109590085 [Amphimedon queenslandica]